LSCKLTAVSAGLAGPALLDTQIMSLADTEVRHPAE
jgi:hypothetical protein